MEVPVRLDHTMASSELKLDRTENRTASSAASCQKKKIHATFRYHEAKCSSAILARIRSLMPSNSPFPSSSFISQSLEQQKQKEEFLSQGFPGIRMGSYCGTSNLWVS